MRIPNPANVYMLSCIMFEAEPSGIKDTKRFSLDRGSMGKFLVVEYVSVKSRPLLDVACLLLQNC